MVESVTPANEQDRAQVFDLCLKVQEATGVKVEIAYADQGYTGIQTALDATQAGVERVVERPEATKGFILLPKRWVVERSFAWLPRFRRLGRNLERLPSTLSGFHCLAACLLCCNGSGNFTTVGWSSVTDRKPYRHRFPLSISQSALWLYHRFPLSERDVQAWLHQRGMVVSHETLRQWNIKFAPLLTEELRHREPRRGSRWFLDEVCVEIGSKRFWL